MLWFKKIHKKAKPRNAKGTSVCIHGVIPAGFTGSWVPKGKRKVDMFRFECMTKEHRINYTLGIYCTAFYIATRISMLRKQQIPSKRN